MNDQVGAVITADVVNFSQITRKGQGNLIAILTTLLQGYKFDFYRGDSFNIFVKEPAYALRLLLRARTAALMSVTQEATKPDIRACIGIGKVDTPVRSLRTATGEAFILSGRNLDSMKGTGQNLIIVSSLEAINPALRVIAYFVDYLFERLTSRQAEVVFELLKNHTQTEVARSLHKSQATINQHVRSASWTSIATLLTEYENLTSNFNNKQGQK